MTCVQRLASVALVLSAGIVAMGCGPSSSSARGATPLGPGSAAAALVGPARHARLRVEIDHVQGHRPSDDALALLRQRLEERTDHPGGVEVVVDDVLPPTERALHTIEHLRMLDAVHRDGWPTDEVGVIHVLYLDGAADPSVGDHLVGAAFGPTSIVIFLDAIGEAVGDAPRRMAEVERWTLVHEAGHVLGLVGLGAPQVVPHVEAYRHGHCDQPGCVMGWTVDERATDFCPRCKDDLRAIGGR